MPASMASADDAAITLCEAPAASVGERIWATSRTSLAAKDGGLATVSGQE